MFRCNWLEMTIPYTGGMEQIHTADQPEPEQAQRKPVLRPSWRLLAGVLLGLVLVPCISDLAYRYTPRQVAARACDTSALIAFYDAYSAPGGYFLGRQDTTFISTTATQYKIEAQVLIVTGGFKGMFDDYPKKSYRASYSCTAISQGNIFDEKQWLVMITQLSDLTPE
jgi:hypothetical protein